jgi:hypothetical protein
MKNKNYHTVGTFPKFNRKFVEKGRIDTPSTYIYLSWLGTGTSIKREYGNRAYIYFGLCINFFFVRIKI